MYPEVILGRNKLKLLNIVDPFLHNKATYCNFLMHNCVLSQLEEFFSRIHDYGGIKLAVKAVKLYTTILPPTRFHVRQLYITFTETELQHYPHIRKILRDYICRSDDTLSLLFWYVWEADYFDNEIEAKLKSKSLKDILMYVSPEFGTEGKQLLINFYT